MRKEYFFVMLLLFTHKNIAAQLVKLNDGIILKNIRGDAHTLQVRVLSDNIVRVSASKSNEFSNRNNSIENKICGKPQISLVVGDECIIIKTSSLIICIDPNSGRVIFKDKQNNPLLLESKRSYKPCKNFAENSWSIQQEFKWSIGEELYGFTKEFERKQGLRGGKFDFSCKSTANNSPLIVSSKGYGVVWDNNSPSYFNDAANTSYLYSEQADQIDYYFIYGPSNSDVVESYFKLIGDKDANAKYALHKEPKLIEEEK
jgi:alpha-D-xyloside xylohydrolase